MRRLVIPLLALLVSGCMSPKGDTPLAQRKSVDFVRNKTLTEMEKQIPGLENRVKAASGYAVFRRRSFSLLHFGTRKGYGVVHDNGTGIDTYMRMFGGEVAIDIGIETYLDLILFNTPDSLHHFSDSCWETSAGINLTLKPAGHGFALGGYAMTAGDERFTTVESGIRLGISFGLGKFYLDDDLNNAAPKTNSVQGVNKKP